MQTIVDKHRLLTPNEAAKFLGVSAGTLAVWRCVARYSLPYVKVGRKILYEEADLLTWLESRKVHQAAATA